YTPKNSSAATTTTLHRSTSCFVGHVTRLSSERTSLRNPKRRFLGFFATAFSLFFSTLFWAFACLPSLADASVFSAFLKNFLLGVSVAAALSSAAFFAS